MTGTTTRNWGLSDTDPGLCRDPIPDCQRRSGACYGFRTISCPERSEMLLASEIMSHLCRRWCHAVLIDEPITSTPPSCDGRGPGRRPGSGAIDTARRSTGASAHLRAPSAASATVQHAIALSAHPDDTWIRYAICPSGLFLACRIGALRLRFSSVYGRFLQRGESCVSLRSASKVREKGKEGQPHV